MVAFRQNLEDRFEIIRGCESDHNKQAAAIELCRRPGGILFFFKHFLWTYDPRVTNPDIPFIPYEPYQSEYITQTNNDIVAGESTLTQKSRDMGVTWMILGVFLYRWLFFNENFLVGSLKEENVDRIGDIKSLFERLRYMLDKLPDWMVKQLGYDRKNSSYMKIYKANGASLAGESMNEQFSRQGRYNAILLDEFSFVPIAETVWRACGDSAKAKFPVSTSNGKTFFTELRDSGKIKVNKLHWSLHPNKNPTWYEAEKAKRSARAIARELDMNDDVSSGKPFYTGFREHSHAKKLNYNFDRSIYRSWDYGYHHPACSFHQIDAKGRWCVLKELMGTNATIQRFGDDVKLMSREWFPNGVFSDIDFGDPAGAAANDKSEKTSVEILASIGIYVTSKFSTYRERKEIIERKLTTTIDGFPSLIIDESCKIIIGGLNGGYHYPELKGGMQFNPSLMEKPFHDEWFSHLMNTVEYFAVNMFTGAESKEDNTPTTYRVVGDLGDVRFDAEDDDKYSPGYRQLQAH